MNAQQYHLEKYHSETTADVGHCTDLLFETVSFTLCPIIKAIYLQVDLGHFVIST